MYKKILAIVKRYTVVKQFLGPHSELDFSEKIWTFTILRETGELEFGSVWGRHHKQGSTLSFIVILRLEEIDTQRCPLSRLYLCFFLIKSSTEKKNTGFLSVTYKICTNSNKKEGHGTNDRIKQHIEKYDSTLSDTDSAEKQNITPGL